MINDFSFSKRSATPEGEKKTFKGSRVLFLYGTVRNGERGAEVEEKASQPGAGHRPRKQGLLFSRGPPEPPERMIRGQAGKGLVRGARGGGGGGGYLLPRPCCLQLTLSPDV